MTGRKTCFLLANPSKFQKQPFNFCLLKLCAIYGNIITAVFSLLPFLGKYKTRFKFGHDITKKVPEEEEGQ